MGYKLNYLFEKIGIVTTIVSKIDRNHFPSFPALTYSFIFCTFNTFGLQYIYIYIDKRKIKI